MRSRKSENNILKALSSLSVNSLRDDHNGPSAEITSDGENRISVQPASHGQDSEQDNIDPNESFIGAQPSVHDNKKQGEFPIKTPLLTI